MVFQKRILIPLSLSSFFSNAVRLNHGMNLANESDGNVTSNTTTAALSNTTNSVAPTKEPTSAPSISNDGQEGCKCLSLEQLYSYMTYSDKAKFYKNYEQDNGTVRFSYGASSIHYLRPLMFPVVRKFGESDLHKFVAPKTYGTGQCKKHNTDLKIDDGSLYCPNGAEDSKCSIDWCFVGANCTVGKRGWESNLPIDINNVFYSEKTCATAPVYTETGKDSCKCLTIDDVTRDDTSNSVYSMKFEHGYTRIKFGGDFDFTWVRQEYGLNECRAHNENITEIGCTSGSTDEKCKKKWCFINPKSCGEAPADQIANEYDIDGYYFSDALKFSYKTCVEEGAATGSTQSPGGGSDDKKTEDPESGKCSGCTS